MARNGVGMGTWVYLLWYVHSLYSTFKICKDGAQILRHLHYTSGIEAICEIWVEKFNPSTYAYETFFKADLDFSTMVDEYDFVSVAIMENGFPAKLKAREDIEYEIDIAENAAVQYIKHDGIILQSKLNFLETL